MYIYNVTVNVDDDISNEWVAWMKSVHIPDVMATGYFVDYKMSKLLYVADEGQTYSIQYTFKTIEDMEQYQKLKAPELQAHVKSLYGDKFTAFRTILEVL